MASRRVCPHCSIEVRADRLSRHILKLHPEQAPRRAQSIRELASSHRRDSRSRSKAAQQAVQRQGRIGTLKVVGLVFVVAGLIGLAYYIVNLPSVRTGGTAPDFTVVDTAGSTFTLSEQRGKPVLLYLMRGTWCPTCQSGVPALRQAWTEYESKGLVILTVDLDTSETNAQIEAYRSKNGASWPFARDTDYVGAKYNAQQPGAKFFVDRSGDVVSSSYGVANYNEMKPILDKLVA